MPTTVPEPAPVATPSPPPRGVDGLRSRSDDGGGGESPSPEAADPLPPGVRVLGFDDFWDVGGDAPPASEPLLNFLGLTWRNVQVCACVRARMCVRVFVCECVCVCVRATCAACV
jgi:hypothetical protein